MSTHNATSGALPAPTHRKTSPTENARTAISALDEHDSIAVLTFGQFSLGDLIRALLDRTGPASLTISTWTAAKAEIEHAYQLLTDQRITTMRWLVDRSFQTRQPAYCAALVDRFGPDAIRTTRTHAKFIVMRGADETFTVHTSANLNANPRLESIQIIRGHEHADWLDGIVDELFATLPAGDMNCELPDRLTTQAPATPPIRMGQAVKTGA